MKQLTYSAMAAARLRANKRQYLSLLLGIFLSVTLVSVLTLAVYGVFLATVEKRYDTVGTMDVVMLDNDAVDREALASMNLFDRIGCCYLTGVVTDRNLYVGYYDDTGLSMMNIPPVEGRMPEAPGEIAMEKSALDVLERDWSLGETQELSVTPVDGMEETRSFTLVGFLPERSVHHGMSDRNGLSQFPAIVTSPGEPDFAVGRMGTHYIMGLKHGVTLDAALRSFWDRQERWHAYNDFYGLSFSGMQRYFPGMGNLLETDSEMFSLVFMACILAGALILSCAVGISGAMEGILSSRQEEIGVLRALGATRRQIRRMFGRENLILAAVVSPVSLGVSCLLVWALSLLLPESIRFAFNLWLLLPIGAFSVAVILVSGYLPLVRASKQMPMGVIRDTAMLRRGKSIRSRREFSPPKLIAGRQLRFHPTRQLGVSLLVGLTLVCFGALTMVIGNFRDVTTEKSPSFFINSSGGMSISNHAVFYQNTSLTRQDVAQIRSLDHVTSLRLDRGMPVTLQLSQAPRYAMLGGIRDNLASLDDEMFRQALEYSSIPEYYATHREETRREYLDFLEAFRIPGAVFDTWLVTIDFNEENLSMLRKYLTDGKIDLGAIHGGNQVIVLAPEVWVKSDGDGGLRSWLSREAVEKDPAGEGAVFAAWNDTFTAGMNLPIMQLTRTREDGEVFRKDAEVTVGAVVSQLSASRFSSRDGCLIITSEEGLYSMGLRPEGLEAVAVYTEEGMTAQEEETLERQLTAIARRKSGYSVHNLMERARENDRSQQQTALVLLCVATVFFAVAVGMIVSSVTRQFHSQERTVGMLRAVGADEKVILDCYGRQSASAVIGGTVLSLGMVALIFLSELVTLVTYQLTLSAMFLKQLGLMTMAIVAMSVVCWLVCRFLLGFRIRATLKKSIIENIKEL